MLILAVRFPLMAESYTTKAYHDMLAGNVNTDDFTQAVADDTEKLEKYTLSKIFLFWEMQANLFD